MLFGSCIWYCSSVIKIGSTECLLAKDCSNSLVSGFIHNTLIAYFESILAIAILVSFHHISAIFIDCFVVIPKIYSYTDFAHSLVYHTGPGCTFVMNYAAKSLVSHIDFKNCFLGLHDSLIHKIVAMCGTVVYDSESRILYRQHNNNLIGFSTGRV